MLKVLNILKKGSRHEIRAVAVMGMALVLVFITASISSLSAFDQKGKGPTAIPCCKKYWPHITSFLGRQDLGQGKVSYSFKGDVKIERGAPCQGDGTFDYYYLKIKGVWDENTKEATEEVYAWNPSGPGHWGTHIFKMKCSDNPWVNQNIACQVYSPNWAWCLVRESFPLSIQVADANVKQAVLNAESAAGEQEQAPYFAAQKPTILLPAQNQVFFVNAANPTVTVKIKVKHQPQYKVELKLQWRKSTPAGQFPSLWGSSGIYGFTYVKKSGDITTAQCTLRKIGEYRLKARLKFLNAPWSDWRQFRITLKLKF